MSARPSDPIAARALAAGASGFIFGIGLALAQMIDPRKVLAFLDVGGAWDASLAFVMGGAVLAAALGFHFIVRRPHPLLDLRFHLPQATTVDRRLLAGAALFGLGWGAAGYCPGPAIASLGFANPEAVWFVPALLAGAGLQRWQARRAGTHERPAVSPASEA
jgi:uncharacterized membrane protein YedE/YeeE